MAIASVTKTVAIDSASTYLGHPMNNGISSSGYWYTYIPASADNKTLGASIVPYVYDSGLDLVNTLDSVGIDATFALVKETWNGSTKYYHGGVIEHIGAGQNDITGDNEDDAYFFAHLGNYDSVGQVSDDGFWWDRLYEEEGTGEWDYYQYHVHFPALYPNYNDARLVVNGNGYVDVDDKAFGYSIQIRVKSGGNFYSNVLARVHTPSIGGAHNSHNDVILGGTATKNYLHAGMITGTNDRFYTFILDSAGTNDWRVSTRTYTDAAGSFGISTDLGTYDLADPVFNFQTDYTGDQGEYPFRASAGDIYDNHIYIPVIYNGAASTYDLKIWKLQEGTTLPTGSLSVQDFLTGLDIKPDCQIRTVGDKVYLLVANDDAEVKLYSTTGNGSFTDEGTIVANNSGSTKNLRIHGFRYNPNNTKYYALISGDYEAGGTYTGQGLYSFSLTGVFEGYEHLDFATDSSGGYLVRPAQQAGNLVYDHIDGIIKRSTNTEPEGIAVNTSILTYGEGSPVFYEKKEINTLGNEYLFNSAFLRDGRKIFIGLRETVTPDVEANLYDMLVTVLDNDNKPISIVYGGDGVDWPIDIFQDSDDRVWIAGYTKSEFVGKRDIWVHGWTRNLSAGADTLEFRDHAVDANGNIYAVGNYVTDNYSIVAKYDYNYNLLWQKRINGGLDSEESFAIALDDDNNIYIVGKTVNSGQGGFDAQLIKLDSNGSFTYQRTYGTAGLNETANSIAVIKNASDTRLVIPVTPDALDYSTVLITDLDGAVTEQVRFDSCRISKVRNHDTTTDGKFLFAGTDGSTSGKFGLCDINDANIMKWNQKFSANGAISDIVVWTGDSAGVSQDTKYIVVGNDSDTGLVMQLSVDSTYSTITKNWSKSMTKSAFRSVVVSPYSMNMVMDPDEMHHAGRYIYALGYTDSVTTSPYMNRTSVLAQFDSVGTQKWQNNFGHMGDDNLYSITRDVLNRNFITVGTSTSHSNGRDAILFRGENNGFGTGSYFTTGSTSAAYYYEKGALTSSVNGTSLTDISAPIDIAGALVTDSDNTVTTADTSITSKNYDGAYGPNGVFQGFVAEFKLDKFKEFLNTDTYKNNVANGIVAHRTSDPFEFYQVATVGDGTADDGNIFFYDGIQHSNGKLYLATQTSGSLGRNNTGGSGVYDYSLTAFNPTTNKFTFFQNGDSNDQEIYALTELSNGNIAFTGRTTGFLSGDSNFGGYDVFLGIFDPTANHALHGVGPHSGVDYYQTGSGLNDRGLAVIDIDDKDSDTLMIIGTTYGAFPGTTNIGSEDVVALKFNYVNDTWDSAYQFGSTTQELIDQNSHPAAKLADGRIAVVLHTAGIFADDGTSTGGLDIGLALLDPANGNLSKYTLSTEAPDFSSAVTSSGSLLSIVGFSEATWEFEHHGVYSFFDASLGLTGKNAAGN